MTRITEGQRDMIEQAIYLPMIVIILERDRKVIEVSPLKMTGPYVELLEGAIKMVNKDLRDAKTYLHKHKIKVFKVQGDEHFTKYRFIVDGFEEDHNYFNARLKNRSAELLSYYLSSKTKPFPN